MSIFANGWIVALVVGLCVFFLTYIWFDRVYAFARSKSVGSQTAIAELFEKMLVEVDPKRMKLMLNLCSYGLGAVFFLLLWPNIIPGLIMAVIMVFVGWTVPKFFVQNMWERR